MESCELLYMKSNSIFRKNDIYLEICVSDDEFDLLNNEIVDSRTDKVTGISYKNMSERLDATSLQLQDLAVNVKLYGAKGDGLSDDSKSIQAALDDKKSIYIPPGVYYIASPLKVKGGMSIYGYNGNSPISSYVDGRQSVLKPKGVGITVTDDRVLYQDNDFIVENVCFSGGTSCIDLPLFHMVKIRKCTFKDFTDCGIVLIRGEKIELSSLFFLNQYKNSNKNISLASISDSTKAQYFEGFNWGQTGTWVDRISIQDVVNQNGNNGNFDYGLYCEGTLSNCFINNLLCHGGIKRAISIESLRASDISTIILDACGSDSNPMDECIHIGSCYYSLINDIQPAYAGSIRAFTQFYIGAGFGTTLVDCYANGDNKSTYGFKIGNSVGQSLTFIGCIGALYSLSTYELIRRQINIIGGKLNSNITGQNLNIWNNSAFSVNFMADSNGDAKSSVDFQLTRSTGKGNPDIHFRVKENFLKLGDMQLFVGKGNPNGIVYAATGAIYIDTIGGTGKTLYVKESGAYNTNVGWVAK